MADKKTEKPATHKYIRGKTYDRVMMLFVLLAVIAVGAGIVASITMFKKYARAYREETLTKVVRLARSEIDFNKIDEWLENGADEEYFSTKEDLQVILDNTPFLQYLYVVKVEPDGFHIVYDLTTSDAELEKYMETEPSELAIGTVFPFEKGMEYYVPALLAGEKVRVSSDNAITATAPKPAALLFDSLDGHIHIIEKDKKAMLDFEYGEIWFSGKHNVSGARKMETKITGCAPGKNGMYTIEACRIKDHALLKISGNVKCAETIYAAISGDQCAVTNIRIKKG